MVYYVFFFIWLDHLHFLSSDFIIWQPTENYLHRVHIKNIPIFMCTHHASLTYTVHSTTVRSHPFCIHNSTCTQLHLVRYETEAKLSFPPECPSQVSSCITDQVKFQLSGSQVGNTPSLITVHEAKIVLSSELLSLIYLLFMATPIYKGFI